MKNRSTLLVILSALVIFAIVAIIMLIPSSDGIVSKEEFVGNNAISLTFNQPIDENAALNPKNYTVHEENDPDIQLIPTSATLSSNNRVVTLTFPNNLNTAQTHVVNAHQLSDAGDISVKVSKSYFGYLLSIFIAALLINNFVFTKYLGLCVFMGTSKRKSTATGMGIVFTIVMLVSAIMSWFFYQFILVPFHLDFLQVVVFIGLVSLTVQAVDTILRKVNPVLFNSFGVYLVLVIANCIIIAVPLLVASNNYNLLETIMLALGAGGGFLLALYLMSSVRERLELAHVPQSFKGLPIAFILAGEFALAFLGFSGLQIF